MEHRRSVGRQCDCLPLLGQVAPIRPNVGAPFPEHVLAVALTIRGLSVLFLLVAVTSSRRKQRRRLEATATPDW